MAETQTPSHAVPAAEKELRFVERLRTGKPILFKPHRAFAPVIAEGAVVMVDPAQRLPKRGEVVLVVPRGAKHAVMHHVYKARANHVWLWAESLSDTLGPYPRECVVGIARLARISGLRALKLYVRHLMRQLLDFSRLR